MYASEERSFFYNRLGVEYANDHRPYAAIKCYKKALSINTEPVFYYNLAMAEKDVDNIQSSIHYLYDVLKLDNNNSRALHELHIIHEHESPNKHNQLNKEQKLINNTSNKRTDAYVEAMKYYRSQIQLDPKESYNYDMLGTVYRELELPHMAIKQLKKAIKLNGNIAKYYSDLGILENDVKDYKNSILNIEKAIQLKPEDSGDYNILGIVNEGLNDDEALKDYKKAASLDNSNSVYFYNLAHLNKVLGHRDLSYKYIKKALSLKPNDNSYKRLCKVVKPRFSNYNSNVNYNKKLDDLIGLNNIKTLINQYVDRVLLHKIRTGIHNHGEMHFVFEGNPGTGKTTVAKLLCKILYQRHITTSKHCVTVNATQLMSKSYGESAKKVRKIIKRSLGGVLFIDEAYYLAHRTDGNSACQDEAMDEFLPDIEDHNDDLVVIMAGYKKQMEHFLNHSNPGLISRFPPKDRIQFPNYSNKECLEILGLYLKQNNLNLDSTHTKSSLNHALNDFLTYQRKKHQHTFSNARLMRNIYDDLDLNFSTRIMNTYSKKQLMKFNLENNSIMNTINSTDVINTLNRIEHVTKQQPSGLNNSAYTNHSIGF